MVGYVRVSQLFCKVKVINPTFQVRELRLKQKLHIKARTRTRIKRLRTPHIPLSCLPFFATTI